MPISEKMHKQLHLVILYVLNPCASLANMLMCYQISVHQFSYFDWVTSLKSQLTYLVLYYMDASIKNACIFHMSSQPEMFVPLVLDYILYI
jgi:hypothetical protein